MLAFPKTLLDFQGMFPTEQACAEYVLAARWPAGVFCPACGAVEAWRLKTKAWTWECKACGRQTSLTAGTVMHKSKLPLTAWFWGAYLVASHSNGISALQLQKQLGLGSYRTAWLMCAKLRRAMVDPQRLKLSGVVEVDEASLPFRTKDEPVGGGQGRSRLGKMPFIVAVEVNAYTDRDGRTRTRPGRIRIEPLRDYGKPAIQDFITRNIEPGSLLRTDGNPSYLGLPGYRHEDIVVGSMAAHVVLPWSHRVISLLKRLGMGTYHGLRRRYIQRYLDEFVWRFNRRKARPATFHKILGLAIQAPPASLDAIRADPADDPDRLLKPDDPARSTPPGSMLGQLYARRPKGKATQPKRK